MHASKSLLQVNDLTVDFISAAGKTRALNKISFRVNKNEVLAIVGESGSGKSVSALSILKLLASPPAEYVSGEIFFNDENGTFINLLKAEPKHLVNIRGNRISMIFQEPMTSLNPVFTCGYQVMEAILQHNNISRRKAKEKTIGWFEKVKLPDPASIFSRYPHQLSGGQKQRVMIAMAMCCNPSLLICDEPTTALDVTVQKTILQLLKDLQKETGMGVIFISHDLSVVSEIANRCLVMYNGAIAEHNSAKEIFKNPRHSYTKGLLACSPVNHKKGGRLPVVSDFVEAETQKTKIENTNTPDIPHYASRIRNPSALMDVDHLTVWFPSKKNFLGKPLNFIKAVDDVSFQIKTGETLGLVGESGCGKTTLGRALLRLIEPTSGKIIYNNTDLVSKKQEELKTLRKEIQIIFQDPYSSLNPRITIGSAIAETLKVHDPSSDKNQRTEKVMEMLRKVDLKREHFQRYPHQFSGGQRQRIVIARALILNPSFIVCDESVSALDVSVQAQVLNLLNDLKREFGFTSLFISHDLSVVRYISDRIMVMNKGKIVEEGPADEIYYSPREAYTKQLIASVPQINL